MKKKIINLKRFSTLVNTEINETRGEHIVRKDYVETVDLCDVLGLLDDVAQQTQDKKVATTLEHTHPSAEFWKGWNKAIDKVLSILVGEEAKTNK